MDINQVLFTMEKIVNDLCENLLEPLRESLNDITFTKALVQHDDNKNHLTNLHNNLPLSLQLTIDKAYEITQKHVKEINSKQTEVERLETIREKLQVECETASIKKAKLKKRLESIEQKNDKLQNFKDCVKVYKLLTGTNFAYKKGSRVGYIKAPNSSNYNVFDFNLSEINQQDITKKLWVLLDNISKEDTRTRTEYINGNNKKIILS